MARPTPVTDIDVSALERLLARLEPLIEPGEYTLLVRVVGTLVALTAEVRKHGTTIARLRRLIGMSGSEKTAAVLSSRQANGKAKPAGSADAAVEGGGDAPQGSAWSDESTGNGPLSPPSSPSEAKKPPVPGKAKKGHGRLPATAYEHARHVPAPHESLCPGDPCPQCGRGRLYELDPAHWLRITGQPPLVAECSCLQRLRCCPCGAVYTAAAPPEAAVEKITDSAVAIMALLRYRAGMPHYRLETIQGLLGTPLPASTQWEALKDRAEDLRPVHEELKLQAAQANLLHSDDTRVVILEFTGKRRAALIARGELPDPHRTGLFTSALYSLLEEGRRIALFMSGRKHAGENLADLLDLRSVRLSSPILMSDALSWNAPKGHVVIECHCLAHARRHFVDEVDNHPDACRYLLERLGEVFRGDDLSRQYRLSEEQRLRLHQRQSAPVMSEIEAWMRDQFEQKRIEPNSGLGVAINYMLKRWGKFTLFLRVPGVPLENNVCERALKAAIRHRNNSLFYRTRRGAEVGDLYMSLLYTAEINGENPLAYLTALLGHAKAVRERPADWLPWTYRATLTPLKARGDPARGAQPKPADPEGRAAPAA